MAVFAALLLAGAGLAPAQTEVHRIEVGGFVGYQTGGRLETLAGRINIRDAMNYGFTFDLTIRRGGQLEFSYTRQDTDVSLAPGDGPAADLFPASVEYFQFGGIYERYLGLARPYGLLSIGWAHIEPRAADIGSESVFAAAIGGGVKIFPSSRVGLRLQARLLMPFLVNGAAWFIGPGGGYIVVTGSMMLQFDLSAGLILAF
jgi:hypothetical protein